MNDMHPDLEWLARNVSEWEGSYEYPFISLWRNPDRAVYSALDPTGEAWRHSHWLQARKDLGLIMSDEEEKMPEEDRTRAAPDFLRQAANLIEERGKQYDNQKGERSIGRTVDAFNAITGRDLSEPECWLLMSLFKRVRQFSQPAYHKDSAEDAVAYAALEAESLEASALRARELEG